MEKEERKRERGRVCVCVPLRLPLTHEAQWQHRQLQSHYPVHSLILLLFYHSIASMRRNQLRTVIAIIPETERMTKRVMNLKPCVWPVISPFFYLRVFVPCLRDRASHVCMVSGWVYRSGGIIGLPESSQHAKRSRVFAWALINT